MKKTIGKTVYLLLIFLLAGLFVSCKKTEKTKTILLPEKKSSESSDINIRTIREYSYEGNFSENQIMVNDRGNLCMINQSEAGYLFQEMDLVSENVINEAVIKGSSITNICLAPGGRYISYEVTEGTDRELLVLSTEYDRKAVLYHWNDLEELFMYQWSGDGSSLFSFEDGLNYAKNRKSEWHIRRYDLGKNLPDSEGERFMEGFDYASRKVLPNQDGSQIFIREEYAKGGETNWLIDTDMECYPINYMPLEINWPVKFSRKGLYVMDTDDNLCLIPNFKEQSEAKTILSCSIIALVVCEKGDHIFFVEEDDSGQLQLCGIKIQNGITGEKQILYKNMDAEAFHMAISPKDDAVFVQLCKFLGDDRCHFTVMALEY